MAHLWFQDGDEVWTVLPLDHRAVDVSVSPPRALDETGSVGPDTRAVVAYTADGDAGAWVLVDIAGNDVRVNGFPPVGGLRVLQDRDEIRVHPLRALFFAAVSRPCVEEFIGGDEAINCALCCKPMEARQLAVRCPLCHLWFHQSAESRCWEYRPACSCGQPTALDGSYQWVPEG